MRYHEKRGALNFHINKSTKIGHSIRAMQYRIIMYYVIDWLEWAIFALSATPAPLETINNKERLENSRKLRKVSCILFVFNK